MHGIKNKQKLIVVMTLLMVVFNNGKWFPEEKTTKSYEK
jgi:hypothetical protein